MKSELALLEPAEPITVAAPTAPTPAPAPVAEPIATADPSAKIFAPTEFKPDLNVLFHILSCKREHDSDHEEEFLEWLTRYIDQMQQGGVVDDWWWTESPKHFPELSNIVVVVTDGDGRDTSKTLFSCHVDTCHSSGYGGYASAWKSAYAEDYGIVDRALLDNEDDNPRQELNYDENFGHVFLAESSKGGGNVLGADDGVGVWICLELIRAGVPGTYIFHRGEEVGCKGSRHMRENEQDLLSWFDRAVAFDRPNDYEIITHQRGNRGCSDEFAKALAKAFNNAVPTLKMEPSDRGVYTDTAEYFSLIPECTNIGVGYVDQHSDDEYLDVNHAEAIVEAAVKIDWEALPTKRDPKVVETKAYTQAHRWQTKSPQAQPATAGSATTNAPAPASAGNGALGGTGAAGGGVAAQASTGGASKLAGSYRIDTIDDATFELTCRADMLEFVNKQPRDAARLLALLLSEHQGDAIRIKNLKRFL